MLDYEQAVIYANQLEQDSKEYSNCSGAYVWFRTTMSGGPYWWLHGRTHDLGGTEYYGFKRISEETAKRLWEEKLVAPMYEPPGHPRYDEYKQPKNDVVAPTNKSEMGEMKQFEDMTKEELVEEAKKLLSLVNSKKAHVALNIVDQLKKLYGVEEWMIVSYAEFYKSFTIKQLLQSQGDILHYGHLLGPVLKLKEHYVTEQLNTD